MDFASVHDQAGELAQRIQRIVTERSTTNPRAKQRAIGLSELGDECARKLAYRTLDWPKKNTNSDPWPSISGTAIHSYLAETFEKLDGYLVEHRVAINDRFKGTLDLFDIERGMVIDHKCVGATSMKARKKDGMTKTQRVQINLYGLGLAMAGYEVNHVALAFYPLGGRLDGMFTIVEPFNAQLAADAIERLEGIEQLVFALDPEKNPDGWLHIPATPSDSCTFCPYHLPFSTDLSQGCPGKMAGL